MLHYHTDTSQQLGHVAPPGSGVCLDASGMHGLTVTRLSVLATVVRGPLRQVCVQDAVGVEPLKYTIRNQLKDS